MSTVSEQPTRRTPLPTNRGRQTQAAIDAAARTVVARKGILATTIADIAAEAGRSTATKLTSGHRRSSGMAYPTASGRNRPRRRTGIPTRTGWRR